MGQASDSSGTQVTIDVLIGTAAGTAIIFNPGPSDPTAGAIDVYIDGSKTGHVLRGTTFTFPMPPGKLQFQGTNFSVGYVVLTN